MSVSACDTQGFRREDQYSLEKNAEKFMPFETPVRDPTAKSTVT